MSIRTEDKFKIQEYFLSGSVKILIQELHKLIKLHSTAEGIAFNGVVYSILRPLGWSYNSIGTSPPLSLEGTKSIYEYLQLISKIDRKYLYIDNMLKDTILNLNLEGCEELGIPNNIWDIHCRNIPFPSIPLEKRMSIQTIRDKHVKAFGIIAKEKALNLLI